MTIGIAVYLIFPVAPKHIKIQLCKINSLIQLLKDGAITLDGVHPYAEREMEELDELYKYKENLMFGMEGI